jgi:short-subunit dehydrogenase
MNTFCNKKIIIIGATSGIGEALAKEYNKKGCKIGIAGPSVTKLARIAQEMGTNFFYQPLDIRIKKELEEGIKKLITALGGMDIFIICAGTGYSCETGYLDLRLELQEEVVAVNITGFIDAIEYASNYFTTYNQGHIVALSSILCLRGSAEAPAYSASKAFIANYLAGMRQYYKNKNIPIVVTDIRPGSVHTAMGQASSFWRSSGETAAQQIYKAIEKKKKVAYITRRWVLISWLFKLVPDCFFYPIMHKAVRQTKWVTPDTFK